MGKVKSTSKHKNEQRVNFLFVVNEYNLNPNHAPAADRWGNIVPPETWEDYAEEHEGRVFRYCGGIVSTEETYTWHRPGLGLAGKIGFWQMGSDELGNPMEVFCALEKYSDFSMFNCGPFLPTIYGAGDVSEDDGCFDGWRALHFSHVGGISQASPNGGYKYVAGQNAGFIDVLLPKAYANADPNAPQSAGLGGQVGLVIGLMALSQRPGTIDAAFQHPKWNMNQWTGHRHDSACKYTTPFVMVRLYLHIKGQHWTKSHEEYSFTSPSNPAQKLPWWRERYRILNGARSSWQAELED
ncbi:hypothetical protein TruAng_005665 [Truncatella angustata]|nr:hypothetical protein TruAng_005665 [Truncatella angustata]